MANVTSSRLGKDAGANLPRQHWLKIKLKVKLISQAEIFIALMPTDLAIKPTKTKAQIRQELEKEVSRYLSTGGSVQNIPRGVSGNDTNKNIFAHSSSFEPRKTRTPVNDVLEAIDARKTVKKNSLKKIRGPKKKLLKDDFGEPIRWVWEES